MNKRSPWLFPMLAALLVLCGPAGAAEAPAAIAAKTSAPVKIRIAYPSGMNGQIPVVMEKAAIAQKHGLDAEFIFFQYGPPMMEAMTSGHVDAVITSLMPVTTLLSRTPGAATVVADLGSSSYSLMVPKNSAVKDIKDLGGRRIAVSFNSDSHLDLLRLVKSAGMDPKSDVKLLNVQPNELVLTLNQGFADAIVIRQPQVLKMQEQFGAKIVHTWPFRFVSIMRSDYLAQHPEAKARYLAALRESILYIVNNKDQASVWFGEKLRVDPQIVRRVSQDDPNYRQAKKLDNISVEVSADVRQRLEDWFAASFEHGLIKAKAQLDPNGAMSAR